MKSITKFNDMLAEKLSYSLSIMTTFYVVALLVTLPLFYSTPTTVVGWAQYLCSVVFQGIALPVLGYTAKKSSDKSDRVMADVYKLTQEIDRLVKKLEDQQDHMHTEIDEILEIETTSKIKKPSSAPKSQPKRKTLPGASQA